jgi:MFS-type transporter involved in bile tolerance (Atg22 family)
MVNFIILNIVARYNNIASDEAQHHAGMAMALPFLISALIVPFLGLLVDKFGKRGYLMMISGFMSILTYILFILVNPVLPLITLGKITHN